MALEKNSYRLRMIPKGRPGAHDLYFIYRPRTYSLLQFKPQNQHFKQDSHQAVIQMKSFILVLLLSTMAISVNSQATRMFMATEQAVHDQHRVDCYNGIRPFVDQACRNFRQNPCESNRQELNLRYEQGVNFGCWMASSLTWNDWCASQGLGN